MKTLTDTTPDAERTVADIYRRMPPTRKAQLVQDAWLRARDLHAAGYRFRFPGGNAAQIFGDWLSVLGRPPVSRVLNSHMQEQTDIWKLVFDVVHVFDRLQIRCALGGSMVSSIFGKPRYTEDANLTAEPFPGKEKAVIENLGDAYYVSPDAVERAVLERGSFNVIHTTSGFKIDVFVAKDTPFEQSAFARRRLTQIAAESIYIVTAEDIILHKLEWHRLGGGVPDRQWNDIIGVLQVQKDSLDFAYLEHWAERLNLTEALHLARAAAS